MHEEKHPAVYIVANRYRGTIDVDVTSALWNRVCDHKNGNTPGFTSRYKLHVLVWYEHHHFIPEAIQREKQLKVWKREWKFRLIEELNPDWLDLHETMDYVGTLVEPK